MRASKEAAWVAIVCVKDLYQVQETCKFFFLTQIQLCALAKIDPKKYSLKPKLTIFSLSSYSYLFDKRACMLIVDTVC